MSILILIIRIIIGMFIIGLGAFAIATGIAPVFGVPAIIALPVMVTLDVVDKVAPFFHVTPDFFCSVLGVIAAGMFFCCLSPFFGKLMSGGGVILLGLLTTGLINQSMADSFLMVVMAPVLSLAIPIIVVVLIFNGL